MPPKQPGKRKDGDSGIGADTGARPKSSGPATVREESSSSDDDDPQRRITKARAKLEKQRLAAEADARELQKHDDQARELAEQGRLRREEAVRQRVAREDEARREALLAALSGAPGDVPQEDVQQAEDQPPPPVPAPPPAPQPPPPPAPQPPPHPGPAWNADEDDAVMAGARVNANQLAVMGEFKGEGDDVELFVMQVIRCREAFDWNHQVTSQLVQTVLKGTAAKWLRSALKTQLQADHLEVWDHFAVPANAPAGAPAERVGNAGFRYALLTRFRELQNGQAAVEAVGDLKQKGSETVDEFYDRIL